MARRSGLHAMLQWNVKRTTHPLSRFLVRGAFEVFLVLLPRGVVVRVSSIINEKNRQGQYFAH